MELPVSLKNTLEDLPEQPGVYRLRDHRGEILYVGKSRNLRDRVRTYFRPSPSDRKSCHLRALTKSVDYLVFETDHQAQEAEWDLIRSYRPEYNTLFLDYWNRPYIRLTVGDPYPRIELTQTREADDAEYYGPYKSTRRLRTMLFALRETVPVRDCRLEISPGGDPEDHERCIEADLGRCTAPCVGEESVSNYRDRLEAVRTFLRGDYNRVVEELESKMKQASECHNYEAASIYRDRLEAVKNLVHYEPFIRETLDLDVWGRGDDCLVVLEIREHRLKKFRCYRGIRNPRDCVRAYYEGRPNVVDLLTGEDVPVPESLGVSTVSSTNEEQKSLLDAAERTARWQASVSGSFGEGHGVTDRVTVSGDSVNIVRDLNGDRNERSFSIDSSRDVLKSELIPVYQNDLENGRVLPDQVVLRLRARVNLDAAGLFRNTRFWFPVFLE